MALYSQAINDNEEARLNALRDLQLLDTPPSESFDRLTRLASRLLSAPVSTISLTDRDRQWFKSRVGVDLIEIPRHQAPCSYAIERDDVFVVPDLLADSRFADSPLAQAGIRFYAGAPLFTRGGYGLGTLCVVDGRPRQLEKDEAQVLKDLAGMVMAQVDLQNMIGRVDPSSGQANQHQLFEDIGDMARADAGKEMFGLLVDLNSSGQAGQGQRVIGADYAEAMVREAIARITPLISNAGRLYHVGTARCAVIFSADALAPEDLPARILSALETPIDCNGVPLTPSPVIGTCSFFSGEVRPRDVLRRLFNAAEDALSSAGRIAHYSAERDREHVRRFTLINDFKTALESRDQLSLVYQPRIELSSGLCIGAEALLRWQHPTLGNISPAEFIPCVEQTALARPMMDWVAKTALAQIRCWVDAGFDFKVSINASALNLDEPDFAERLMEAIRKSGVSPRHLELEFTESAVGRDSANAITQLEALRNVGVDIAIDDFGTGYSNLSYLQELPATILKIDRAFIDGLTKSHRSQTLVHTVIAMARELGYRIVAEGIENQDDYDLLAEWKCDEGQGFLMARPMPVSEMNTWLAKHPVASHAVADVA